MATTKTYSNWKIVGVSGGPDSMALLNMLNNDKNYKTQLVVVHINYGVREDSQVDESIVRNYCETHHIPCVIYQAPDLSQGNFQKNARDFRFNAFKEVYDGYQANTLYLAHHLDDHLETILFQLLSQREPDYLGIRPLSKVRTMKVIRPLLDKTKQELIDYCHQHNLEYAIDSSNAQPVYTRNIIRQELTKMSDSDKSLILDYQKLYQRRVGAIKRKTKEFLRRNNAEIKISTYSKEPLSVRLNILRELIDEPLSKKHLIDLDNKCLSKIQQKVKLTNNKYLIIEYNVFYVLKPKIKQYSITVDKIQTINHQHFNLNTKEGSGFSVKESDFPLTIRNAKPDDSIKMRYGTKKLNRFFIDRKIKTKDRLTWPVVENNQGNIICVTELGCDVEHYIQPYNLFIKRNHI